MNTSLRNKKGFWVSLFALLLAMTNLMNVQAQSTELTEIIIGEGTESSSEIPFDYFNSTGNRWSFTECIFPAEAMGDPCMIYSISFYCDNPWLDGNNYTYSAGYRDLLLYIGTTDQTSHTSATNWVSTNELTNVFERHGGVYFIYYCNQTGWFTFVLDHPFMYEGGNLVIGINIQGLGYGSSWSPMTIANTTSEGASLQVIGRSSLPDANTQGTVFDLRPNIKLGTLKEALVSIPATIDLGPRPNNCSVEPYKDLIYNEGIPSTITSSVCDNSFYSVNSLELPYSYQELEVIPFDISTGTSSEGTQTGNITYTYGDNKILGVPINAVAYNPTAPDVWELAPEVTTNPFIENITTNMAVYDNYRLPGSHSDGKDVVYKLDFDYDVLLTANVTNGDNGKVALYREEFEGKNCPMVDNFYYLDWSYGPGLGGSGFEKGTFDIFNWENDSNHPWAISTHNPYEGGFCLKSSIEGINNSSTSITFSYYVSNDITMNFRAKISSEAGWDKGFFYIDGIKKIDGISGDGEWISYSYDLTQGIHTFKWEYTKDSNTNKFDDCFCVDNIFFGDVYQTELNSINERRVLSGTYYLVASSTSEQFTVNISSVAVPLPMAAALPTPPDHHNYYYDNPSSLSWHCGDNTSQYQVLFGETNPPTTVLVDWTDDEEQSCSISGLSDNKTYYWRVNEKNTSGITEGPVWTFTTFKGINASSDNIIYVTQTGAGIKDGSSWTNAATNIQAAIDAAAVISENRPVIWVAKGNYFANGVYQTANNKTCCFFGHDGVKLYGGFNGDEPVNYDLSLRNLEANATILDAESQCFVVVSQASEWDGFVMQHGGEGGFYSYNGTSMIQHCKILYSEGYGVLYYSGGLTCYHNQVSYHAQDGIAMETNNIYSPDIRDCVVSFNNGNGICSNRCVRCQICNNGNGFTEKSSLGGTMIGCLVANNDGFGARCKYIVNSTIVNNGTALVRVAHPTSFVLCNNIIWGNAQLLGAYYWYDTHYSMIVANNAIQGGIEDKNGIYPCIKLDNLNVTDGVHPGFVHPSSGIGSNYTDGDWRLLSSSPCINMGMENMENNSGLASYIDYLDIDYAGNQRFQQGRIDLGAWESPYEKPNYLYPIRPDANNIIYVKADGQGDGSSWANATANLRDAIETSILYEPAATIWVAQGIYTVSNFPLQVKEQLRMCGGFEGTEPANYDLSQRDFMNHASVLDGNNTLRVLNQKDALIEEKAAVIDGFTLRNGTADNGAGAYLLGNTTLSSCTLDHNTASSNGGGIYAENARVENCILMNNTAQQGGGIYAKNAQIVQSIVGNNKATANGGSLYLNNSDLYQSHVVRNEGGGLAVDAADYNTQTRLMNNIIWGNDANAITYLTSAAQTNTTLSHCAVEGLTNHELGNIPLSADNDAIFGPNFVNPTEAIGLTETLGDWHLASVSPCINAGSNTLSGTTLPDYDIEYNSRIFQNGTVDMGVYELMSETLPVVMEFIDASIVEGDTYIFFGTVLDTPGIYEHQYTEDGNRHLVLLNLQLLNITYVSENGAGTNDGSSWENALDGNTVLASGYTKLADALQNADGTSCFWVASGTYLCSGSDASKHFVLTEGVRIYGGFAGSETTLDERDLTNNITQFSGEIQNDGVTSNNTDGVFVAPDAAPVWNESAYLDGITITQGYNATNTKGGALWVGEGTKVTINQCKVTQNWEGSIYNNGILEVSNSDLSNNRKETEGPRDNRFMPDNSGYGARGAGVLFNLEHGIAYFDNCNFESNFSEKNGVVFNDGILRVNESLFDDNTASQYAAVYSWGKVILTNTVFNNNRAIDRTGVMMVMDSLEMVNCTLSNNHSNYYTTINAPTGSPYPGHRTSGIEAWGYSYVDNCQFLNNDAGTRLGGAFSVMGTADLKNCTFIGNKGQHPWLPNNSGGIIVIPVDGSADGGALFVQGTATATDCVFSENLGAHGSTIGVDGTLTMERCKIVNSLNSIGIPYGAIKVTGTLTIKNSLLANNRDGFLMHSNGAHSRIINSTIANMGATLFMFEVNTNESTIDLDNCIVAGYSQWAYEHEDGVVISTNHTLVSQDISGTPGSENDPLFVNPTTYLGYDENVNPLDFDWTLQAGSPCINAGDVTLLNPEPDAIDLAGEPRVKDGQIDMGAYEFGTSSVITQTVNLAQGWNWFVATVDITLEQLEEALGTNGIIIMSQESGYASYEDEEWSGTLQSLVPGQVYNIQVSADCSFVLSGGALTSVTVTIVQGYNWIGYTGSQAVSIEEALVGFTPTEEDSIISFDEGFTNFEDGEWSGTLTQLQPGQGYIYISKDPNPKQITFIGSR